MNIIKITNLKIMMKMDSLMVFCVYVNLKWMILLLKKQIIKPY